MARQEDTCWRCGALWASGDAPRTTLQVIAGGMATHVAGAPDPRIAVAVAVGGTSRGASDARLDADRWINDGGSVAAEAAVALDAVAGRR
jgi:hypothetical protein